MERKPDERSPRSADQQESPAPERPVNTQEAAGQDIASLDDPPQAEGKREDVEE